MWKCLFLIHLIHLRLYVCVCVMAGGGGVGGVEGVVGDGAVSYK